MDHEEEHDGHRPGTDQQGEVEEEREDLAGCVVGCGIHGNDVADTEGHERDTEVDQKHAGRGGTLTG